jgi:hypothetical protein
VIRARRPAARPRDVPGRGPFAMHALRSQATVAAVACLLGLLVVVQLRAQTADSGLSNKSAQDLTGIVGNLNTENDRLRTEISALDTQLEELRSDHAGGASSVEQIQAELAKIRAWAGLDPVAGKGVTITVTGDIDARGVNDLLNELHNAGAEAIAIEDVRVADDDQRGAGLARRGRLPAPRSVPDPGDRPSGGARRVADARRRHHRPARGDQLGRDDRGRADHGRDDAAGHARRSRARSWPSTRLIPSRG